MVAPMPFVRTVTMSEKKSLLIIFVFWFIGFLLVGGI